MSFYMLRILYFILLLLLLPFISILFLIVPRGRKGIIERLGFWKLKSDQPLILLHGASMGEARGLFPILESFEQNSKTNIIVTTTTTTGQDLILKKGTAAYLLPFDWEPLYHLAFGKAKIKLAIITETEIWPGLVWYLKQKGVPIVVVNARISDGSWRLYRALKFFFSPLLKSYEKILVSDAISFGRYKKLGVSDNSSDNRLVLTGNTKYDIEPSIKDTENAQEYKNKFFLDKKYILTLGSLRVGEEKVWFSAIKRAKENNSLKEIGIVVAPRHAEKFSFFKEALEKHYLIADCWNEIKNDKPSTNDIVLLDTLGELEKVYSFTTVGFIGGSIESFGGHNPLEAAPYGVAIVMGSSVYNVLEVVQELKKVGGILTVNTEEEAFRLLEKLSLNPDLYQKVGLQSKLAWNNLKGAKEKVFSEIGSFLD